MELLSEESKAIVERYEHHRDQCLEIQQRLGKVAARRFNLKWRGDPANPIADKEFSLLMSGN